MHGRWATRFLVTLLLASLLMVALPQAAWSGGDDEGGFTSFINGIGEMLYFLAWPTADYDRVSISDVSAIAGGAEISVRLHGTSAFSGDHLWTDLVIVIRNGEVKDLRWGRHNAILAEPGSTITAWGEILADLSEEYSSSRGNSQGRSSSSTGTYGSGSGGRLPSSVQAQASATERYMRSQGFSPSHELYTASLRRSQSKFIRYTLYAGNRYVFTAHCDNDCSDIDLYIYDANDRRLAQDIELDDQPAIGYRCSSTGTYTVQVKMVGCSIQPCAIALGAFSQ